MPISKIPHASEQEDFTQPQATTIETPTAQPNSQDAPQIEQTNTFRELDRRTGERLEERRENEKRYSINVDDETYKQFNQIIAYSDNPEETAYRIGTAQKYSEMLDIPLVDAYANLDALNKEYWGDRAKDTKSAFKSVVDMLTIGKNNVKIGELGQKIMNAESGEDSEENRAYIEQLYKEYEALQKENALYADNGTPRSWITSTLQAGAQSLPYTMANAGAALFGGFIGGMAGAIAAGWGASTYLAAGQEYLEMREKGVRAEYCRNIALVDGAIQGTIEAALDSTLGVIGGKVASATKGVRGNLTTALSEKITKNIAKKLHFGSGFKIATNWLVNSANNIASEGAEETFQQITGDTAQNIAISKENKARAEEFKQALNALHGEYSETLEEELRKAYPQIDTMTIGEIVKDSANAFIEGAKGAIALGLFNAGTAGALRGVQITGETGSVKDGLKGLIDPYGNVEEYLAIRDLSEKCKSKEMFSKAVKDSAVFEGMSDEAKAKVTEQIFEEGQKRANEKDAALKADIKESRDIGDNAEASPVDETGERTGKAREYRTKTGELYTEEDSHRNSENDDDGKAHGRLLLGDPTRRHALEDDGNRYGYIGYSIDGDTVTIDDFKMTAGRENLAKEFYEQFAEKFADKNIQWNPKEKTNLALKQEIVKANPNGKSAGLNYFTADTVADNKTRIKIAQTIRENTKNWSDEQVSAGTALLTSAAKARGENLTDFVNNYFHNGQVITNKESDVSNIAQAAAQHGASMANVLGATQLDRAGKAIIYIGEKGDFNTFAHELGHFFRKSVLTGDELLAAEKEFGVDPTTHQWTEAQEEAFADGFTDYLRTGKAKTKGLEKLFSKIAEFLENVIRGLQGQIKLNDDLIKVYDSLLADDGSGLTRARKAVESAKAQEIAEKKATEQKEKAEKEAEAKAKEEKKTAAEKAEERADRIIAEPGATTAEQAEAVIDSAVENAKLIAYHGSAYKFDKFSTDFIGKGEGSQAFGYGLYFTNNEDIARAYATRNAYSEVDTEKLRQLLEDFKKRCEETGYSFTVDNYGTFKDVDEALDYFKYASIDELAEMILGTYRDDDPEAKRIEKEIENIYTFPDGRDLYKVSLTDGKYLLWDEKVSSEDVAIVKQALQDEKKLSLPNDKDTYTGAELYHAIQDLLNSDKEASEFLNSLGYKGINYPAGTIHGNGNGARNFVIFKDDDIKIDNHILFQTPPTGHAARLRNNFKNSTAALLNTQLENTATGTKANFSKGSQRELANQLAHSKENGFTLAEHFEAICKIEDLFKNATLEKVHDDTKHNDKGLSIERYLSKEIELSTGKKANACITVKHSLVQNVHSIYALELMDTKKALEQTRAKGQDHKGDLPTNKILQQETETVKGETEEENIFATPELTEEEKEIAELAEQGVLFQLVGEKGVENLMQHFTHVASTSHDIKERTYANTIKNTLAKIGVLNANGKLNKQSKLAENGRVNVNLFSFSKQGEALIKAAAGGFAGLNEEARAKIFALGGIKRDEKGQYIYKMPLKKLLMDANDTAGAGKYLFAAYPELENVNVRFNTLQKEDFKDSVKGGTFSWYNEGANTINIGQIKGTDFDTDFVKKQIATQIDVLIQKIEADAAKQEEVKEYYQKTGELLNGLLARNPNLDPQKIREELRANAVYKEAVKAAKNEYSAPVLFQIIGEMGAGNLDAKEEIKEGKTRLENLAIAKQMTAEGKDAKTIRLATGWEKGARKWRYEIGDNISIKKEKVQSTSTTILKRNYHKAEEHYNIYAYSTPEQKAITAKKIQNMVDMGFLPEGTTFETEKEKALKEYEKASEALKNRVIGGRLEDCIKAPELFAAYPQLKDYRLRYIDGTVEEDEITNGWTAGYLQDNTIYLHSAKDENDVSTLIHELQHAIQEIEGFSKGGNVEEFDEKGGLSAYEQYRRTAGEVEARNVESRMNMTAAERLATLLAETEDVRRADQIILDKASVSYCQSEANAEKKLEDYAKAIKDGGQVIFDNPNGEKVIFDAGILGDLTAKNKKGYGIKHLIASRYLKDNMSIDDICTLLMLIQDIVETEQIPQTDKNRVNLEKGGIWVSIAKEWQGKKANWIITGFPVFDEQGKISKEATDSIKTGNAQYRYALEHSSIREQVGAVIDSINDKLAAVNSDTAENPLFQVNKEMETELFNEAKKYDSFEDFRDCMQIEDIAEYIDRTDADEDENESPINLDNFIMQSEINRAFKAEELERINRELQIVEQYATESYALDPDDIDALEEAERYNAYKAELIRERDILQKALEDELEVFNKWTVNKEATDAFYKTIFDKAQKARARETNYSQERDKISENKTLEELIDENQGDEQEAVETFKDQEFYDFISTDEYALSQFLKEVAFIAEKDHSTEDELNKPSDEEELAVLENRERLADRYRKEMRHGSFRYAVLEALKNLDNENKVELTDRQRKTIMTLIRNNKRDYRDLYADFMNDGSWSVEEGYRANDKLAVRIMSPDFHAEDYTPEERKRLADKLDFKDLKQELKDGTMRLEFDTVQKLANGFEDELKEIKSEKRNLEKKIEDIGEASRDEIRRLKYLHDKELKKIDEKEQAREVQKLKVKLLKNITRKVRFDSVYYEQGQKIQAVQKLFTPQLMQFVDKFLNSQDEYLQEAYVEYKTSFDYRAKMRKIASRTSGNSGMNQLVKLFESGRPYNTFTDEEKRLIARYLPRTDWIKELKLEELQKSYINGKGKEKQSPLRTDFLTEKETKYLESFLSPELMSLLTNKQLRDWTLDDVEELAKVIDELRTQGREKLREIHEIEQERASRMRDKIEKEILSSGLHIEDDDTPEEKERKQKAIEKFKKDKLPKILGIGSATKGTYKASLEKENALHRLLNGYGAMNMKRFARMLDNGENGINTTLLFDMENDCFNKERRAIEERSSKIEAVLEKTGLSTADLAQFVTVDFGDETQEYTIDELLYFKAASLDEKSHYAVMCGNMYDETIKAQYRDTPEKQKAYLAMCEARFSKVLEAADKAMQEKGALAEFAAAISQDYDEQYYRMDEACKKEFHTPMGRVEHYVPLVRLESNGDTNEQKVKADMLGLTGSVANNSVDDEMRKQRADISPANQKPVEIGLFKTWNNSLNRTEHFIAYAGYVKDLNRVYFGRDGAKLRMYIENRYGKHGIQYIRDFMNEVANPDTSSTLSDLDKLVRTLRGRTAPAYLAWKMSGIIKQACTSPYPFMAYATPAEYLKAVIDFTAHKEMQDAIRAKSAYMNSRVFDPMIDLLNEQAKKETSPLAYKYDKFMKIGMSGLEAVDWCCVAPGWLAVYRKEKAALQSEEAKKARYDKAYKEKIEEYGDLINNEAVRAEAEAEAQKAGEAERDIDEAEIEKRAVDKADEIVRMCQPSSRLADISPMFKTRGQGSELVKAYLQFTTSLNVIWQNIRYDLPLALKKRQMRFVIGTLTGYILAGVTVGLVTEGLKGNDSDDDDEETKRKKHLQKLAHLATTQFTDAVPVFGSLATGLVEGLITGKWSLRSGGDLFPVVDKMRNSVMAVSKEQYDKAAKNFAEAMAIELGLPISGAKELLYSAGIGDGDGKLQPHPTAFLGRRPKGEKEKGKI